MVNNRQFRRLIFSLYRMFPNGQISKDLLKKTIKNEKMIEGLIDAQILLTDYPNTDKEWYMLGPNALPLVSAWESEKLAIRIKFLTLGIMLLTIVMITIALLDIGI